MPALILKDIEPSLEAFAIILVNEEFSLGQLPAGAVINKDTEAIKTNDTVRICHYRVPVQLADQI